MWAKERQEGVITAFFALVFLLVIAMLLCLTESARLNACSRMAQSILRFGTKSLLGSYDLSLYENYHIFGRSVGEEESAKEKLAEELSWYMQQNLSGNSWLCMRADMPEITGLCALTEKEGAMFYAQAIQYEKYREVEEFAKWMLLAVQETKKAEKIGVLLQKSLEAEQSAAEAEETLAELLGCLDGFAVEQGTLVRNLFGRIKTVENFAKKLVPRGAGEWLLAGNAELYAAQKGNYTDPVEELEYIVKIQKRIEEIEKSVSSMRQEYEKLRLWASYPGEGEEEEEEKERAGVELRLLSESISAAEGEISSCRNTLQIQLVNIRVKIEGARNSSKKALDLLLRLDAQRKTAEAELVAYGMELSGFDGEVPDTIYEELTQQNKALTAHFSQENSLGILKDIDGMQKALEENIVFFDSALACIRTAEAHLFDSVQVISLSTAAATNMIGLNIQELVLDYQNVKVPQRNNPYTKLARQFFKYGILSLVVEDGSDVERGIIQQNNLPSKLYKEEEGNGKKFSFQKLFGQKKEDTFSISAGDTNGFLAKTAGELTEEYLYLSYLKRHFAAYTDNNNLSVPAGDGTVEGLLCQLEYIIAGEESDKDNLSEIAVRIFFVRLAMNLAVIFSSHECRTQIKTAAAAAVGFTGIGALIVFAELLIAMLWATECALTETSGLFLSGEVSFFPTVGSLAVSFRELSKVSKEFWQQSAKRYTESKAGGILKSYREYLYLFLALEKPRLRTMRTMDVIQQVIQLKYDRNFLMKNCIYSLETKAEFTIPYLFLPVVGIRAGEGVKQEKKAGISY